MLYDFFCMVNGTVIDYDDFVGSKGLLNNEDNGQYVFLRYRREQAH